MKLALCLVALVLLAPLAAALPVGETVQDRKSVLIELCRRSLSRIIFALCSDAKPSARETHVQEKTFKDCCVEYSIPEDYADYCRLFQNQ